MGIHTQPSAMELEKRDQIVALQRMQRDVSYHLKEAATDTSIGKKIPILSRFLENIDTTGAALMKVGEQVKVFHPSDTASTLSNVFQFGGVAMAVLDFVRIPFIYLMAFLLNEKVPISLNNNARLVYSGFLLALTLLALAVPATASVIAFIAAGTGLVVSLYALGSVLYDRYRLIKQFKAVDHELAIEEKEMGLIQERSKALEQRLQASLHDEEGLIVIYQEMAILKEQFRAQTLNIEALKIKQAQIKNSMQAQGVLAIVDKSIGLLFTSLGIIGLLVSIFNPPVGIYLLAVLAVTGSSYALARVVVPAIISLSGWLISQIRALASFVKNQVVSEHHASKDHQNLLQNENDSDVEDSSTKAMKRLGDSLSQRESVPMVSRDPSVHTKMFVQKPALPPLSKDEDEPERFEKK